MRERGQFAASVDATRGNVADEWAVARPAGAAALRGCDHVVAQREAHAAGRHGRYVPHSEIDWWLARAFEAAGQRDSAHVYAAYVRDAWRRADPSVRAKLDSLP